MEPKTVLARAAYVYVLSNTMKPTKLSYYNSNYKLKSDGNIKVLHLKLLLKS